MNRQHNFNDDRPPATALIVTHEHSENFISRSLLAALQREACHLTRRDGLRRFINVGPEGPTIEAKDEPTSDCVAHIGIL